MKPGLDLEKDLKAFREGVSTLVAGRTPTGDFELLCAHLYEWAERCRISIHPHYDDLLYQAKALDQSTRPRLLRSLIREFQVLHTWRQAASAGGGGRL